MCVLFGVRRTKGGCWLVGWFGSAVSVLFYDKRRRRGRSEVVALSMLGIVRIVTVTGCLKEMVYQWVILLSAQ